MVTLRIERTTPSDPAFDVLVSELTAFLAVLNGEKDAFYTQFNKVDDSMRAVLAYYGDMPVGCGAFRPMDDATVEIKRMFVDPAVRGNGVGKLILAELENWAVGQGFQHAILETSIRLEPAVSLYKGAGYEVIPNYGPYVDVADSVCLWKDLLSGNDF